MNTDTATEPTTILCGLKGHLVRFDPREVIWDELPIEHSFGNDIVVTIESIDAPDMVPSRLYCRYGERIAHEVRALVHRGHITRELTFWLLTDQALRYTLV